MPQASEHFVKSKIAMILYSGQALLVVSGISLLVFLSVYLHFVKGKHSAAILLLLISGFLLRLLMAAIDPYLHDWDERFHALVAKNMIRHPFLPMMRIDHVFPYRMEDWCCNHIWLHKQPLFLWQMALSMKIFGVNEVSMRLPSVLMGTLSVYFIYDMALKWLKNRNIAFLSALLFAVSYYQLELTSGRFSLDQNDVAFAFYMTASFWAFTRYLQASSRLKWAVLTGVFVGAAVLVKWLTGILVFGGWGLWLLLSIREDPKWKDWRDLGISLLTSVFVFLPWQLYIMYRFPQESALTFEYNRRHIFEVLEGHQGSAWYHLAQMPAIYGRFFLLFIPIGIYCVLNAKQVNKKQSIAFLAMIAVIYFFFSVIVQTKMPSFAFPVNALIWIIIATGIMGLIERIQWKAFLRLRYLLFFLLAIYALKPWQIISYRSVNNAERNMKIHNTRIYKSLDLSGDLKGRVILNCKSFEENELMFYRDVNAYAWYPAEKELDRAKARGYRFAAFANHGNYRLPAYISEDEDILIIDNDLQ